MLVLEGYGMLVPSRPKISKPGNEPVGKAPFIPKGVFKPLKCPDGSYITKSGCKPKPPMQRPKPFKVPMVRPLIGQRPTKPAVMVKPSPKPDTTLIEKAKVEVTPETKAAVVTKPTPKGPSIATMAMIGIPLAAITYFIST